MKYRKVTFTKVAPEVSKQNRRFYERRVRKAFVQYLAYTGWFNGVLTNDEIEMAKQGQLPKDLDIHHIFPISGSNSEEVNSFTNLTVLHKSTHISINRNIFFPQLKDVSSMKIGEKRKIYIPDFPPVDQEGIIAARNGKARITWINITKNEFNKKSR